MKRSDGRGADELRHIEVIHGFLSHAEGSVLIKQGGTWVLCVVSLEDEVPPFLKDTGRGWITAEYALLPRSTAVRTPRESRKGRIKGRTQEIQRLIGRSLRAIVDLELLGPRTLRMDCDVLIADGGTRTASITGAFLALRDAVDLLLKQGTLDKDPIIERIGAVSVGLVDGQVLLDLNYDEDCRASVDANFVLTESGKIVEVQATGEQGPFDWTVFDDMTELARKGVAQIINNVR